MPSWSGGGFLLARFFLLLLFHLCLAFLVWTNSTSQRFLDRQVTQVMQVPKDTKHNAAPAGAVVGGAFLAFLVVSGLSVSFVACCSLVVGFCGFVASCLLRCMACLFFGLA